MARAKVGSSKGERMLRVGDVVKCTELERTGVVVEKYEGYVKVLWHHGYTTYPECCEVRKLTTEDVKV